MSSLVGFCYFAFRCYIRAFKDAADYGIDTGSIIAGTKGATNDDFVTVRKSILHAMAGILYCWRVN